MGSVTVLPNKNSVPQMLNLQDDFLQGGQAKVYFDESGQYAIKIYHEPRVDQIDLLDHIMLLFGDLPDSEANLLRKPLAIVNKNNNSSCIGFVMDRVSGHYKELRSFIRNPVYAVEQFQKGYTWENYLKLAKNIAYTIALLHRKKCAHTDIHYQNFLAEIENGDVVMLELDGVVVGKWLPPQVKGRMGFIAPEILVNEIEPSEITDLHSLAVLLLHTLLFRNPLEPLIEYADHDPKKSEELGWGDKAVFSEHRHDTRHRPEGLGKPLYNQGCLSFRMLTPALQRLTERAVVDGLHQPSLRPSATEWFLTLARMVDELWLCTKCGQRFPFPWWKVSTRRRCPFCGESLEYFKPIIFRMLQRRADGFYYRLSWNLVASDGTLLYSDISSSNELAPFSNRNPSNIIGEIKAVSGIYQLWNRSNINWRIIFPSEDVIKPEDSIKVENQLVFCPGDSSRIIDVLI